MSQEHHSGLCVRVESGMFGWARLQPRNVTHHGRFPPPQHADRPRQSPVATAHPHTGGNRRSHWRDGRPGGRGGPRPSGGRRGADLDRLDVHLVEIDRHHEDPELLGRYDIGLGRFRHERVDWRYRHGVLVVHLIDDIDDGPDEKLLVGHGDIGSDVVISPVAVREPTLAMRSFRAIGTTATVVVQDPRQADEAARALAAELRTVDATCSRFRPDSELQSLHAEAGRTVVVSTLLFEALSVARHAAERTGGAVDPTVGNAIAALGYDADLDEVRARRTAPPKALGRVVGYQHVQLDARLGTVRIPRGVRLDLGSTATAWAADRAAARIACRIGAGALVSLGGDVAVAGPPPTGGWTVGIARASSTPPAEVDQVVAVRRGGLASSGTTTRTWTVGDRTVHHIIDPRNGDCVEPYWDVVSATGSSCVEANILTTAAIVWGERALDELPRFGQAVRLVRADGEVSVVNGWPLETAA
jgi:FAD:protein FMN transferase